MGFVGQISDLPSACCPEEARADRKSAPPGSMIPEIQTLLRLTKGYRLRPWQSPYLRWRIETWSGLDAAAITPKIFVNFSWEHRSDLFRYLRWAGKKGG